MARRPRKSQIEETEQQEEGQGPGAGHNNGPEPLTDEEQRALAYHHKRKYQAALRTKKDADAALKNVCKLAKTEEVSLSMIKHLIDLDSEEGQAKIEADIAERYKAAQWAGLPIGAQDDLFNTNRQPLVDKAFARGETAALNGEDVPTDWEPGTELGQACLKGWQQGQAAMASLLKKKETPAPILDAAEAFPEEGDGESSGLSDEQIDAVVPPTAHEPPAFDPDPEMPAFLKRQQTTHEPAEVD